MKRVILACAIAAAGALVLAPARDAQAHFERAVLSARSASMGGAFVALADDPSAVVDNPAGLSGIPTFSFLATYDQPYGVDGIYDGYIAAVLPLNAVSLGASYFQRSVQDLDESMITLAVARDLKRTSEDASLSIGATVDFARVAVSGPLNESATAVTCGGAVLLRPFAFIGLGYSIRNIIEPSFDLIDGGIDGGGETGLSRAQTLGLSYYWENRLQATFETHQDADGEWQPRGGLELRIENHVLLRGGMDGEHATAGVGIRAGVVTADVAMTSHDELGATYLFTLRYARPGKGTP